MTVPEAFASFLPRYARITMIVLLGSGILASVYLYTFGGVRVSVFGVLASAWGLIVFIALAVSLRVEDR